MGDDHAMLERMSRGFKARRLPIAHHHYHTMEPMASSGTGVFPISQITHILTYISRVSTIALYLFVSP